MGSFCSAKSGQRTNQNLPQANDAQVQQNQPLQLQKTQEKPDQNYELLYEEGDLEKQFKEIEEILNTVIIKQRISQTRKQIDYPHFYRKRQKLIINYNDITFNYFLLLMGCGAQSRSQMIIFPHHQFQDRIKVEEEVKATVSTLIRQINDFENVFKEVFEKMAILSQNDQRFISTKELKY